MLVIILKLTEDQLQFIKDAIDFYFYSDGAAGHWYNEEKYVVDPLMKKLENNSSETIKKGEEQVILTEIGIPERKVLLWAFDYSVDDEGFVLNPKGRRIHSEEIPSKHLKIEEVMILPKVGGGLKILDGTPTAISKYLRTLEEAE